MSLEKYFKKFRRNTVGHHQVYYTPYGRKKMIYADWIASGRLYDPIEKIMIKDIGPFVGNTHTETSENGKLMTKAYHLAHKQIKAFVNADRNDAIFTTGYGMTGAIVKFQRILGLKTCGMISGQPCMKDLDKPVVFITHMEHHSNHTSWYETYADVEVIPPADDLQIDVKNLETLLIKYKDRSKKIGAFTACSNVTGIRTPYYAMARLMHEHGGVAFIDFAASAPYDTIDMHPADPMEKLDAIYFSPHKFLGGPGSSGVVIFDSSLYNSKVPDQPGGGTVDWTNAWGEYKFIDDIETREDGGTPGFLQAIRAALAMQLKEKMGVEKMHAREKEIVALAFQGLKQIPDLHILADHIEDRLGVISFYIDSIHYNLVVRLLSDRFGIQTRGGCACAGTYGHYLLDVSYEKSKSITEKINTGDLSEKPGWVRVSLHPTMKNKEVLYLIEALKQIQSNHKAWSKDYYYDKHTNEYHFSNEFKNTIDINTWLLID